MGATMTIDDDPLFSPEERVMYHATFAATMRRAAAIIERITKADVEAAQLEMHKQGVPLADLAKIDRATLAVAHLRTIAAGEFATVASVKLPVLESAMPSTSDHSEADSPAVSPSVPPR